MLFKDFVDGGASQRAVVLALQLALNAAGAEPALAEVENPLLLLSKDFLRGRFLWSFTMIVKAIYAMLFVAL
jgi:hypothetical protein